MHVTDKTGWAVMGTGTIATEYMVSAIRTLGHQPRWVVSRDKQYAQFFSEDTGIDHTATSARRALSDPEVAFAYVSAARDRRRHYVMAASAARKHILCDGPIASTSKGAAELVATCLQSGISLVVNQPHRASSIHQTMHRLVREGEIGILRAIQIVRGAPFHAPANRRMTEERRPGDMLLDITVNDVDLARFLTGKEPEQVVALPIEASASTDQNCYAIHMSDGVIFQAFESFEIAEIESLVILMGDHGSLTAHGTLNSKGPATLIRRVGNRNELTPVREGDPYHSTVEQFVDAIGGNFDWLCSGEDNVAALRTVEAIAEANRKHRKVYL
ncbi:Gfo/Idh/MocA family oxidoreductase [Brucella sp. NBRC 12950]|uniref:Gfo/Idh/MocA family protein n=1 Tax=Brucella sp. NBRC 12950 TaxID=2994518 RepID=UPI0024A5D066|nr:Gfo/Idh/MocA family oxidoreductase [Brucella sp. NBRC 12950]GLU30017.1 oxidoreductase [Brucella sp. NBRC 12950]